MPDILLFESSSATFDPTYPSNIVVSSNGDCNFVPPGIFKSTCSIDMTWDGAAVAVVAASPTQRLLSSVSVRCPVSLYRARTKGLEILLSNSQAGSGRKVKQEQEEISRNHVQTF